MKDMEKNQFEKLKLLSITVTVIVFFSDLYYYYYQDVVSMGINNKFLDFFIAAIQKTNLFAHPIIPKFIIFCCAIGFVLFDKAKKDKEIEKDKAVQNGLISSILFLSTGLLPSFINSLVIYVPILVLTYMYLIESLATINRVLDKSMMNDRYNLVNKIFPQTMELIENEISINIPYNFVSKYEKIGKNLVPTYETGYINFIAPERSTLILGKPGSGKSYSFNEEFIRQAIMKAFAMINYDFKFPTLTNIAYNYYLKYNSSYDKYDSKPRFAVINLDDPRYSDRCNPLHPNLIEKKQHAIDAVYTIFFNLDKKSAIKQDFFQMSAMSITTAVLWFLKGFENGKYCSFPHLIELIQQSDEKLLPILDSYPELRYFTSAFSDALAKGSFEQLSGQTASARIPLGKCATPEMFWVMTDPDNEGVDLRVNRREAPIVLNIANNPQTQKTNAAGLGLYMSQAGKLINDQDRIPCLYHVDELPTIFINGLNTLIATARSNKVSVVLSAQDYTQLVMDYGKEIADTIFNTVGNIASGQVAIDTARKISDAIGKINYQNQSVSINSENTSVSYNTQRDYIVPPEDISQMTQGEFVGIVADTFEQNIKSKAFKGLVAPSKSDLGKENYPMRFPELTQELLYENEKSIQADINYIIKFESNRLEELKAEALNFEERILREELQATERQAFDYSDDDDINSSHEAAYKKMYSEDQSFEEEEETEDFTPQPNMISSRDIITNSMREL